MKFKEYKLSDVVQIIGGGTPKRSVAEYWNGEIPWISIKDFSSTKRINFTQEAITSLGLQKSSSKILDKDDIVISARGTVGLVAQLGKPMAFNQSCYGLKAREMAINDFLYYWLKQNVTYVKANTHGSVFDTITKDTFNNLLIKLPSLKKQKKIVSILDSIDSKIEINNQIISNLEELASTLFKRWFVDFEFPDENGNPYKSSGGKMVDSELGEIPDGWRLSKIGEEVQIVRGASPRPIQEFMSDSSGRPWVKISDANSASSCFINRTKQFIIDKGISRSRTVEPGTLILSNSATPGIPKFMDILASVHDGWLIFNDYRSFSKEFLYLLLLNKRKSILSLSNGSVFRNLKTDILKKFPVVVPNEIILRKAQILYENIFKIILHHSREITTLEQLRESLLPKLLSGEIELPEDEEA